MLRTFAVALLAASVITAPVFAQGTGAPATPSVKTETKADSATPKVVNANPTLKSAKVKTAKRHYARRHVTHVKHVAQVKRVRHVAKVKHVGHVAHVKRVKPVAHVKVAHATHGTKWTKAHKPVSYVAKAHTPVRHVVSKSTAGQNGAMAAPKAKSNVN